MIEQRTRREKLATVLRHAGALVTVEDAAEALGVSRKIAARTLWRWHRQGWLSNLRRGLYAPVPLDAMSGKQVLPEPWILVPALFHPGYIGGWSAAEHWDLTEQMFRSLVVYTARPTRPRTQMIQGISYILRRVKPEQIFGMHPVWHGKVKVLVSDVHRTVVDMLDDPGSGGGIRHVNDCLRHYLASDQADMPTIFEYADSLGNGAVFKRLGFLLSRMDVDERILESCRSRLTTGNAKLDLILPCRRLVKKWRLWIPKIWEDTPARD